MNVSRTRGVLLRLEGALGHHVQLECVRLIDFLAANLVAHVRREDGDPAGSTAKAHETIGDDNDWASPDDCEETIGAWLLAFG